MLKTLIILLIIIFCRSAFAQKDSLTLPVELVYFEAYKLESSVLLLFGTATEINNYGFDIERADESRLWQSIGFVPGHGTIFSPHDYSFEDTASLNDGIYYYRLKQIDTDGNFTYSFEDTLFIQNTTSVREDEIAQSGFYLYQNYPNPFNASTVISFYLKEKTEVKLSVYNLSGEILKVLIDEELSAGNYSINFSPDQSLFSFPSGILFCRLQTGNLFQIKKMIYLK